MVHGDKRPNLVALLVPDAEFLSGWAKDHEKSNDLNELADDPDLYKTLSGVVDRVNADFPIWRRCGVLSSPASHSPSTTACSPPRSRSAGTRSRSATAPT